MAAVTAAVGGAVAIGGSLIQANQSKQAAKNANNEANRKAAEIEAIERNRQPIPKNILAHISLLFNLLSNFLFHSHSSSSVISLIDFFGLLSDSLDKNFIMKKNKKNGEKTTIATILQK